ncbi:hypothetical protein MED193_16579 [Roseobacter sp. MED193]|nr:hypothetical protein MED193_16579 [Roseobacter sp. MED193]
MAKSCLIKQVRVDFPLQTKYAARAEEIFGSVVGPLFQKGA